MVDPEVKPPFEAFLDRFLPPWIDWVQRRSAWVVALSAVLALVSGIYAAARLEVNTEEDSLFDEELPHRAIEIEYNEIFPNLYENIVILVDAESPEQAREAAARLAARLEARPDLFSTVHLPQSEFFEEHALLYMDTGELEDFADRLARVQPYLATLAEDGSLRGLAMMLARGVRALRDGDVSETNLEPMLERIDAALRARLSGEDYHLSWAEVVAGRPLEDSKRRLILAQPIRDFSQLIAAGRPLSAVRDFARELGLTPENGVSVRMTGDVALAYEEMGLVERQARGAGVASFVLVTAILFVAFRSLRLVLAALLTLVAGLVVTAAFAALAIGHLNLISVAFEVLFIGLGIDYGVHVCMSYQECLARGLEHAEALRESATRVGGSLFLCTVTAAIGFYSFLPSDFSGVAELGLISGSGMFVSLFLSFTLLPALMCLGRREGSAAREAARASVRLVPGFPTRHPVAIAVATIVLVGLALIAVPRARFERNPLLVRDPSAESVQAFEELLSEARTSPWNLNALAPDLASALQLAARLNELSTVESAFTVESYVPDDQMEKLEIIEDVAVFLAPPPAADGAPGAPTPDESMQAIRDFRRELSRLVAEQGDAYPSVLAILETVREFIARLESLPPEERNATLEALEQGLLGALPRQLDLLNRAVAVDPITLDALPEDLVDRMVSSNGMVRVQIFPSEDLTDPAALERFVETVREVAPRATGSAVAIYAASNEVVKALKEAFAIAVAAIVVMLLVIWRRLGDTVLVMAPMALSGLLTAAAAVVMGVPFNFADVIVLPLLLGIGVDTSIHLVHRARHAAPGDSSLLETSTANAAVYSALTTIASFGSLAFASHRGMASLGQLLTLGLVVTIVCNLVALPALLELRARRERRVGSLSTA
jgi:hopanoid biosynthesis associated RND transporter like protein HpnN